MPRYRPPVPPERVEYLKKWITDGAPDGSPPGLVGVRHERDPGPEPEGPQVPPLSFAADIDRPSMLFRFDLHRYEDVSAHADAILTRLSNGSMPCDGAWPAERVEVFAQWIAYGKLP